MFYLLVVADKALWYSSKNFFTDVEKVTNYQQAINCNTAQFNQFYHGMLEAGVYLAPASYEAGFVSKVHDDEIVAQTIAAADAVFAKIDK